MYIKQVIETPEGDATFQGNLAKEELQFLLEYAINSLMQQGALPFVSLSEDYEIVPQALEHQQ